MRKELAFEYDHYPDTSSLSGVEKELVIAARKVSENAYAPYSKFRVGAALILDSGEMITGSNQENIAYPSGLCAERVALFHAGANYPDSKVKILCIVADGDLVGDGILSPCGACRQVMVETEGRQDSGFNVILVNTKNEVLKFHSASDLLPLAFGKK